MLFAPAQVITEHHLNNKMQLQFLFVKIKMLSLIVHMQVRYKSRLNVKDKEIQSRYED